jgi:hypothetical protein
MFITFEETHWNENSKLFCIMVIRHEYSRAVVVNSQQFKAQRCNTSSSTGPYESLL